MAPGTLEHLKHPWTIALLLSVLLLRANAHNGVDHGDTQDLHSKGLISVKVWCLVILLLTTFAGGVSPYFLRWNESFLVLGTQFAGGVFLGFSLMHFLADSTDTFTDLTTKTYPFSFMLASVGFLLIMLADCVVAVIVQGRAGDSRVDVEADQKEKVLDPHPGFVKTTSVGDTVLLIFALCFHSVFEGIAIGVADTKADAWRSLWAISLHKIFAAIAMGIALLRMLPKRPLLMTVGYSLAFAISSPVGVGIGIAIDATTQGRTADWIYAISMGLACGIFVYVAINHLIAKGFKPSKQCYLDAPFYKYFAVVAGVGAIAVVMIWD